MQKGQQFDNSDKSEETVSMHYVKTSNVFYGTVRFVHPKDVKLNSLKISCK